jgi:hypothetical protein
MKPGVDISGFSAKIQAVIKAAPEACKLAVSYGTQEIFTGAAANLKGPHYGTEPTRTGGQRPGRGPATGTMPIPRITGNLAASLSLVRPTDFLAVVFADKEKANYALPVHEGVKGTKRAPRRFLHDVVRTKRDAIKKEMNRIVKEGIDKVGNP